MRKNGFYSNEPLRAGGRRATSRIVKIIFLRIITCWYSDLDSHLEEGRVKKGVEDNTLCSSI